MHHHRLEHLHQDRHTDESYTLTIAPTLITIVALNAFGAIYALETLSQFKFVESGRLINPGPIHPRWLSQRCFGWGDGVSEPTIASTGTTSTIPSTSTSTRSVSKDESMVVDSCIQQHVRLHTGQADGERVGNGKHLG
jgi:hypothetical protein